MRWTAATRVGCDTNRDAWDLAFEDPGGIGEDRVDRRVFLTRQDPDIAEHATLA